MAVHKTSVRCSAIALLSSLNLVGCAALSQKANEVTIREPGHRTLGKPKPVAEEARRHWQFAWLAEASYRKLSDQDEAGAEAEKSETLCATADNILKQHKWQRWLNFPDKGLLAKIKNSNLRVEIWENTDQKLVAVSFGGTVFKSGKDWKSNLRWFIPNHKDEYTEIVDVFGPAFIAEYKKRVDDFGNRRLIATGHSLGGGLAQQFAYSFPRNELGLKVSYVYAFDPSPVTGYYSVDKSVRSTNSKELEIDRIYERGEVLAIFRSFTSFFVTPSESNPSIRGIRYNLLPTNPIGKHSMLRLACQLQNAFTE